MELTADASTKTGKMPAHWLWRSDLESVDEGTDSREVEAKSIGRAVVFDIDGVLANAGTRQHFITEGNHDWKGFFEACIGDEIITESVRILQLLSGDVTRILLTGRPAGVQEHTVRWLENKKLPWDLLIMRDRGEYAESINFKRQSIRKLKVMGFDVELAFEDDPMNHKMFIDEGVPCMYVHSGYYDMRDQTKES